MSKHGHSDHMKNPKNGGERPPKELSPPRCWSLMLAAAGSAAKELVSQHVGTTQWIRVV